MKDLNQFVSVYPVSIISKFQSRNLLYNKKAPVKDEGSNLNVFTTE